MISIEKMVNMIRDEVVKFKEKINPSKNTDSYICQGCNSSCVSGCKTSCWSICTGINKAAVIGNVSRSENNVIINVPKDVKDVSVSLACDNNEKTKKEVDVTMNLEKKKKETNKYESYVVESCFDPSLIEEDAKKTKKKDSKECKTDKDKK